MKGVIRWRTFCSVVRSYKCWIVCRDCVQEQSDCYYAAVQS